MKTLRLREIYQSKPKGVKYTIYRGEKPAAFHDSGIPMGTAMPRKAFMHGVPSKLINHVMDKLENEVPSEKFYTELEEGLPAKIATAAGISLAGDVVAKGIKKIAKKVKDDPKDADEELEELAVGQLAGALGKRVAKQAGKALIKKSISSMIPKATIGGVAAAGAGALAGTVATKPFTKKKKGSDAEE